MIDPWLRANDRWADTSVDLFTPSDAPYWDPLIDSNGLEGSCLCNHDQFKFYKHIAVDIVTESVYNYPYPCVTEKTLRPIANKRMFILVAPCHTLKLLHEKGFQTFSDVIDERYDLEPDPVQRWHMVCQSIQNFVVKPVDEIRNILEQHRLILENNYNVLVNLEKIELSYINDPN